MPQCDGTGPHGRGHGHGCGCGQHRHRRGWRNLFGLLNRNDSATSHATRDEKDVCSSSPMASPTSRSSRYAVVDKTRCTGCELCAHSCPIDAIVMKDQQPIVDTEKCVGCGVCAAQCPKGAIAMKER